MAKVTNLNQFRKTKARADKKARANVNAVKFGRTKAQKNVEAKINELDERRLDGAKRDET